MGRAPTTRLLITLVASFLVVSSLFAPVSARSSEKTKRSKRTVEGTYSAPGAPLAANYFYCAPEAKIGCVIFPVNARDRYVRVDVADVTGVPVPALVYQEGKLAQLICDASVAPIEITRGLEVWVLIYPRHETCPGAVGTTGTVKVTFSSHP